MDIIVKKITRKFRVAKNDFSSYKTFRQKHSFDKRHEESSKILIKYPTRIPVICERFGDDIPNIDRSKYLVPDNLTISQFLYVIRKRIKIPPEKSIYLFINKKIMPLGTMQLSDYYEKHSDEDGFLYITYSGENTFG
jgi:GABA(A) receptor-associated protein